MTARKKPADKQKAGRPTKYEPGHCEAVVAYMAQGYSLTAFAGSILVSYDTVNDWTRQYPEFLHAVKRGKAARTAKLEADLLGADQGPRVTARIFALKNAAPDEWADKQKIEHSGDNGGPIRTVNLTATEFREIAKAVADEV